jgi:hypothetical protein
MNSNTLHRVINVSIAARIFWQNQYALYEYPNNNSTHFYQNSTKLFEVPNIYNINKNNINQIIKKFQTYILFS